MGKKHYPFIKKAPNPRMYTEDQVREMMNAQMLKTVQKAVNDYSCGVCMVLRDHLHFGPKRAQEFLDKVGKLYESIAEGYLSVEDIKQTILEELGVHIK